MKLSQVVTHLEGLNEVRFQLPNGTFVPKHFHITEVGAIQKDFIDCGGTIRSEKKITFQLWYSNDVNHQLFPEKMKKIIDLSIEKLNLEDVDVEVEYQGETINTYDLQFEESIFRLIPKFTDCLASDNCGIPKAEKPKINLSQLSKATLEMSCEPNSGCCS